MIKEYNEHIDGIIGYRNKDLTDKIKTIFATKTKDGVPLHLLVDCLVITEARFGEEEEGFYTTDFIKYFYGVLRNKINEINSFNPSR